MQRVKERALSLLTSGEVDRVLGWKAGEFFYDLTPAVFTDAAEAEKDFVYGVFSGANLSKYLIAESRKGGKVAVFLKPCDSYSLCSFSRSTAFCAKTSTPSACSAKACATLKKSRPAALPV